MRAREAFYNDRKSEAFLSENYTFTKQHARILHKPIFTLKKSKVSVKDLTYRKINDWDAKGLVSGTRDNKRGGWRRFSIVDVVKLRIVSDLRRFGFHTDKIRAILERVSRGLVLLYNVKRQESKAFEFLQLEYFVFASLEGNKVLLSIDESDNIYFLDEKDTVTIHFGIEESSSPLLILPFFSYVQKIATGLKRDVTVRHDSTIAGLLVSRQLTEQEKEILEVIRTKDYEELTIVRSNGDKFVLRAKIRERGDFSEKDVIQAIKKKEYQNVSVSRVGGRQIIIIREETIKV